MLDDIAARFTGVPKYRALFLKGYLLLRKGRKAEAEPVFDGQLTNYIPLKAYVDYYHATSLMVTGSEQKGLDELQKFIEANPTNRLAPLAFLDRINELRDLGQVGRCDGGMPKGDRSLSDRAIRAENTQKMGGNVRGKADFDHAGQIRLRILRDFPDSDEASDSRTKFSAGIIRRRFLAETDRLDLAFSSMDSHPSDAETILAGLVDSPSLVAGAPGESLLWRGLLRDQLGNIMRR